MKKVKRALIIIIVIGFIITTAVFVCKTIKMPGPRRFLHYKFR